MVSGGTLSVSSTILYCCVRMGFEPLVWFCRPEENGIWAKTTASALGAYTPCGIESFVGCISNVVLMGLCLYRLWLIMRDFRVQRFCLRSKYYNYMLAFLAGYCASESLYRLLFDVSMFEFDAQSSLAPFEVYISFQSCRDTQHQSKKKKSSFIFIGGRVLFNL